MASKSENVVSHSDFPIECASSNSQSLLTETNTYINDAELMLRRAKIGEATNSDRRQRILLPQRALERKGLTRVQTMIGAKLSSKNPSKDIKESLYESESTRKSEAKFVSSQANDFPHYVNKSMVPPINPGQSSSVRKEEPKISKHVGPQRIDSAANGSKSAKLRQSIVPCLNKSTKPTTFPKSQPALYTGSGQASNLKSRASSTASNLSSDVSDALTKEIKPGKGTSDLVKRASKSRQSSIDKERVDHSQLTASRGEMYSQSEKLLMPPNEATRRQKNAKNQRPPFSTLQRHFSPAKSSNAQKSSFPILPENAPENTHAMSSDTMKLQTELLQLYLLHYSAAEVDNQWQQSAEEYLERRFENLCMQHVKLERLIQSNQASVNQFSLTSWYEGMQSVQLAQMVQLLSGIIMTLHNILGSGGKYRVLLRQFELWLAVAMEIRDSRKEQTDIERDLTFLDGLGTDWEVENIALERKLAVCFRELKSIRKPDENSTLYHMLSSFQVMVANHQTELETIRNIEKDIMAKERSWVENRVRELNDERMINENDTGSNPYGGIWGDI